MLMTDLRYADDPERLLEILALHQKWLSEEPDGKRADLQGTNLQGVHLEGANLKRADLRGVNLSGAHLQGAWFLETNLEGADLSGAYRIRHTIRSKKYSRKARGINQSRSCSTTYSRDLG